ncbi:MAG TPA: DUF302 domain-containing protein, partial [Epsilonproteobacteria bacterium]|nr:DUF302 domain-containing protein [Campylobacterota bacterium]
MAGCQNKDRSGFLIQTQSSYNFEETLKILNQSIRSYDGLVQLGTIDHAKNAKDVNQTLKPNTVILFDNLQMATHLIECNPSMGLDLPLRLNISRNYQGQVFIQYTNPEYWSLKHNIKDKECL